MGRTWSAAQVVPGYDYSGTECAGLTTLASGRVLLNQWQFHWYPLALSRALPAEPLHYPEEFASELAASTELDTSLHKFGEPESYAPWARGHGTSFVHISDDEGRSFTTTTQLDTGPFHGGYGLRGCVEMLTEHCFFRSTTSRNSVRSSPYNRAMVDCHGTIQRLLRVRADGSSPNQPCCSPLVAPFFA